MSEPILNLSMPMLAMTPLGWHKELKLSLGLRPGSPQGSAAEAAPGVALRPSDALSTGPGPWLRTQAGQTQRGLQIAELSVAVGEHVLHN